MSQFTEDLAIAQEAILAEMGDPIVYTPAVGSPFTTAGIPAKRGALEFEPIPAQYIVRWCSRSDFPVDPLRDDSFAIAGETFNVVNIRFDEGGGVYLIGEKQ